MLFFSLNFYFDVCSFIVCYRSKPQLVFWLNFDCLSSLFSDGTIYELLCSFFFRWFPKKDFSTRKLQPSNNLFFIERNYLKKQAQEKIFFSPIIFLLLDTFTQYNFKMPTSYFFQSLETFFFLLSTFFFVEFLWSSVGKIFLFIYLLSDKCKFNDLKFKSLFVFLFFSMKTNSIITTMT